MLFYAPGVSAELATLDETESRHCIQVLRHRKGDEVNLVDGEGGYYMGDILEADPKACLVRIRETNSQPHAPMLELGIAPPKNIQRFEWFLEKATEIGIARIFPLICHRSERKKLNLDRAKKILITAMKQALRAHLPQIEEMIDLSTFIQQQQLSQRYVASQSEGGSHLSQLYQKQEPVLVLIGPEGDFTKEEMSHFKTANYTPIILGKSRLRTETAGVASCQIISAINDV